MKNPLLNRPTRDWREERGWGERSGAKGAFGETRYGAGRAGYNPAGPAQGYGDDGYAEPRSWGDIERDHDHRDRESRYAARDYRYGDGGPVGRQTGYRAGRPDRDYPDYSTTYDRPFGRDGRGDYRSGRHRRFDGRDAPYGDYDEAGFGDPNPYVRAATDGETQGKHHGRGPKDYRRSDDRIREDVNDHLTDHHHLDASNIKVEVKDGEVTLSGTVDRRRDKRRAEDCAEHVSGVRHVQNNLRVDEIDQTGRYAFPADKGKVGTRET